MTDLAATRDRLRELAERATAEQVHPANWSYWVTQVLMAGPARDFIEAASPQTVLALLADTPSVEPLDAAWREAEAALPDSNFIVSPGRPFRDGSQNPWHVEGRSPRPYAGRRGAQWFHWYGEGTTLAAALRALVDNVEAGRTDPEGLLDAGQAEPKGDSSALLPTQASDSPEKP